MDTALKSANSNRYVIEDSIHKVTSDGEPHEVMTIVAVVSGLIAAIIVLSILGMLIDCHQQTNSSGQQSTDTTTIVSPANKKSKSILPLFISTPKGIDSSSPRLVSVTTISAAISNNDTTFDCNSSNRSVNDTELTTVTLPGITTIRC